ncbi:site-specific integrase [Bacillus salinus]|uniref:site-specific integrase n=1 Tax=Bacillus sp. HMF5848 TaxID=2495421 RepID=UPI00289A4571|nr:tyrosine-type recombinase/integrase [Bacillus sp. HMF5848]
MEKAIFEFMFSTGCRIGEVVSLDRNCINWTDRSAIVRGKGDKEREVYFNIRCDIWLKRYIQVRTDQDPAIFVTENFIESTSKLTFYHSDKGTTLQGTFKTLY